MGVDNLDSAMFHGKVLYWEPEALARMFLAGASGLLCKISGKGGAPS